MDKNPPFWRACGRFPFGTPEWRDGECQCGWTPLAAKTKADKHRQLKAHLARVA